MKLLSDTQYLIWAMSDMLPARAVPYITDSENGLFFSPVSIWEVVIKRALNKPDFRIDPEKLYKSLLANGYRELPVISPHSLQVAALPPIHKDPFDRLLIAQAQSEGITLLSSDEEVAQYSDKILFITK